MSGVRLRPWQGLHVGGVTWRRDLALPVAVAVIQLAGTWLTAGYLHYQHSYQSGASGSAHVQGRLVLGMLGHRPGQLTVLDWVLVAVGPVALALRHRYPVAVAWTACLPMLAPSWLLFAYLSLAVACFGAASRGHRQAAWAVIAAGYVSSLWLAPLAWGRPTAAAGTALFVAAWLAVLISGAEVARMRRERRAEALAAREADASRRASEERVRMARDLHDMIGHTISLISIQAGVGLDLMDTKPEQARAALTAVRTVSREALDELRSVLAALREDGEDAPRFPVAGLSSLPELISRTAAAGLAVSTDIAGRPRPLPRTVDLAAYRIVQESLTNVARHAGPTAVTVRVEYGQHELRIEVTDDGPALVAAPPGRGMPSAGAPASRNGDGRPRNGIDGMRERAAALGGRLDAGPRADRGFGVRACLPLDGSP